MTIKDKLQCMLINNGMSYSQAEAVMSIAILELDNILDDYQIDLNASSGSYPDVIYNILYSGTVKPIALKWINDNKPLAWFKPMFE
jgi:hypothetical protein